MYMTVVLSKSWSCRIHYKCRLCASN